MTSHRLPGKAMMPVAGMASVLLSCKRASRGGMDIVVATSTDPEDDILAQTLEINGVSVFRGSLDDVLGRVVMAAADMPEDSIIIRLTGDNLFPDADFVGALIGHFHKTGRQYINARPEECGLPYGMCGEVVSLAAFRQAANQATAPEDRGEFVTPWIKRNCGVPEAPDIGLHKDLKHLRCTIDTLDDYRRVSDVFARVNDPVNCSWRELCRVLDEVSG